MMSGWCLATTASNASPSSMLMTSIGHPHGWRPFVGVDSDDRLAVALEGDDHFFAEFAGAEEEDFLVHAEI